MLFKVYLYKNRHRVGGRHKGHYSRRSLRDIKVVENTHTDGEEERGTRGRSREGTGGGM